MGDNMLNINEILEASKGKLVNGSKDYIVKNYSIDSRKINKEDFFIPIIGENVNGHDYIINCVKNEISGFFIASNEKKYDEIVMLAKNINSNINIIEVDDTLNALQSIGKLNKSKYPNMKTIGITGSVGKTSTREMISYCLETKYNIFKTKNNYNSEIGIPMMLLQLNGEEIAVLEIGIGNIGDMEKISEFLDLDIAVITNIGNSHIEYFKTRENILEEKFKITSLLKENGTVIVNLDDEYLKTKKYDKHTLKYYTSNKISDLNYYEDKIEFKTKIYENEELISINALGVHNIINSLCAIKVCEEFKLTSQDIKKGIANYRNFPRRLEIIKNKSGCTIIDDAYNASYESIKSGLETINNISNKNKIVVLGDVLELGSNSQTIHNNIGELFSYINVNKLYLFGNESKYTKNAAKKYINHENIKHFDNKEELINTLKSNLDKNDLIYLKASNGMNFKYILDNIKD